MTSPAAHRCIPSGGNTLPASSAGRVGHPCPGRCQCATDIIYALDRSSWIRFCYCASTVTSLRAPRRPSGAGAIPSPSPARGARPFSLPAPCFPSLPGWPPLSLFGFRLFLVRYPENYYTPPTVGAGGVCLEPRGIDSSDRVIPRLAARLPRPPATPVYASREKEAHRLLVDLCDKRSEVVPLRIDKRRRGQR